MWKNKIESCLLVPEKNVEKWKVGRLESVIDSFNGILFWNIKTNKRRKNRLDHYIKNYGWKFLSAWKYFQIAYDWIVWKDITVVKDIDLKEILWKKLYEDFFNEYELSNLERGWNITLIKWTHERVWMPFQDERSVRYKKVYDFRYNSNNNKEYTFTLEKEEAIKLFKECLGKVWYSLTLALDFKDELCKKEK